MALEDFDHANCQSESEKSNELPMGGPPPLLIRISGSPTFHICAISFGKLGSEYPRQVVSPSAQIN